MTARKYTSTSQIIGTWSDYWGTHHITAGWDRNSYGEDNPRNFCNEYHGYGSSWVGAIGVDPGGNMSPISVSLDPNWLEDDYSITDADRNELLVELFNKIHDNPFDAAADLAEIDETISGIRDNVAAISGAITSMKRGDFKRAARFLGVEPGTAGLPKTISKAWLQWNFAWKPTFGAVASGAEKLASLIEKPKVYKDDFRVTCTRSANKVRTYGSDGDAFERSLTGKNQLRYAIRVATTIQNNGAKFHNGPGSWTAARVKWERTSMSWAIDYILPIGGWLNAMEVAPYFSVSPVCSTSFSTLVGTSRYGGGKASSKQWALDRCSIVISPVFPRMNSLNSLLRINRIANLAAVAILRLGSLK